MDLTEGTYYVDYNLYMHESKTTYDSVADAIHAMATPSDPTGDERICNFQDGTWVTFGGDEFDESDVVFVNSASISVEQVDLACFGSILTTHSGCDKDGGWWLIERRADSVVPIVFRVCSLPPHDGLLNVPQSKTNNGTVDHLRVKATNYFYPAVTDWPLGTQELPISLVDATQITTANFTTLFCAMPEYSGLSPTIRLGTPP